ncbi:MAG: cation:proton antiporter [Pseudobdellovibrionaceae bacterium]
MLLFIYILMGILLGPSFLQLPAPEFLFSLCSFGFLFTAGLELNTRSLSKEFLPSAKVAMGAFILPFAVGWIFFKGNMVIALALAISALPVVVQIPKDLKLYTTKQGHVIIAAATLCDLLAWAIFTLILPSESRGNWLFSHLPVFFFFFGLVLSRAVEDSGIFMKLAKGSGQFFFGPLFFIGVGMKIHWQQSFDLNQFLIILLLASVSKITGAYLMARIAKFNSQDATLLAIVLNARGAMEILFCSIALRLGLIDATLFTSLTLMAVVSSILATPAIGIFRLFLSKC